MCWQDYKAEAAHLQQLAADVERALEEGTWPAYPITRTKEKSRKFKDLMEAAELSRQVSEELQSEGHSFASTMLKMAQELESRMDDGFYPPGGVMKKVAWPGDRRKIPEWQKGGVAGPGSLWEGISRSTQRTANLIRSPWRCVVCRISQRPRHTIQAAQV